jgi:hypothetical protein
MIAASSLASSSSGRHCAPAPRGLGPSTRLHGLGALARQQQPQAGALAAAMLQTQQQQQQNNAQQQQRRRSLIIAASSSSSASPSAAAAAASPLSSSEEEVSPARLSAEVADVVSYALKLAWTAETYKVHSWGLLLGLLRHEDSAACAVLRELGLDDLRGAWNEVLWAMNAADGLEPRGFTPSLEWGRRAHAVLAAAGRFAGYAGREAVLSQDLLLALAASDVLEALFPDVDLSFDAVKAAAERASGDTYALPGYEAPPTDPFA